MLRNEGRHPKRGLGDPIDAVPAVRAQPAHREVGIAYGLDLLDARRITDLVEPPEQLVELLDEHRRRQLGRDAGEVDEVAEENGDVLVPIGDWRLPALEPADDPLREDVQQEPPRLRPLLLELAHQARHDRRIRILELLELAVVGLETAEPPLQDTVLLLDIRPRYGLPIRHR